MSAEIEAVYCERNALVRALSTFLPAHLARHPAEDTEWEDDWRWIVCIHGPTGQMTWHILDSEVQHFSHLSGKGSRYVECPGWDGHTTEEKYRRLARL